MVTVPIIIMSGAPFSGLAENRHFAATPFETVKNFQLRKARQTLVRAPHFDHQGPLLQNLEAVKMAVRGR